jgi:hypothetical protein
LTETGVVPLAISFAHVDHALRSRRPACIERA